MTIKLDHTVIASRNKQVSARFLAEILGTAAPVIAGPFLAVRVDNEVTLDFLDVDDPIVPQHYAFIVGETEFDEILSRVQQRQLSYWADPMHQRAGQTYVRDSGRGFYFEDPSGHNLEVLTRSYGA